MSVTVNQIVAYGCAQMPEADSAVTGGALDTTKRVAWSDLPFQQTFQSETLDVVGGTSGDTGVKIQVQGRDTTGALQTPAVIQLTGTTVIANAFGAQQFQRLSLAVITGGSIGGLPNPGGTAATSDVAIIGHNRLIAGHTCGGSSANTNGVIPPLFSLQTGDGTAVAAAVYAGLGVVIRITSGPAVNQMRYISASYNGTASYGADVVAVNRDWTVVPGTASTYDLAFGFLMDISPNPVTAMTRLFQSAAADVPGGSQRIYYEKIFILNTNGTSSLLAATVQIISESAALPGAAALDLATGSAFNDSVTIANRQTTPTGTAGFVVQPSPINVPSPGNLPNGNTAAGSLALWLRLTLPAGTSTYQGAGALRTQGNTT